MRGKLFPNAVYPSVSAWLIKIGKILKLLEIIILQFFGNSIRIICSYKSNAATRWPLLWVFFHYNNYRASYCLLNNEEEKLLNNLLSLIASFYNSKTTYKRVTDANSANSFTFIILLTHRGWWKTTVVTAPADNIKL